MTGRPMAHAKRTWNGMHERRAALATKGIRIPEALEGQAGLVAIDDVLDAAAAAWSADRLAAGQAIHLPDDEPTRLGSPAWIWA